MKFKLCSVLLAAASAVFAGTSSDAPKGDYLEVRSCDVFTGYCFANSEMNLDGKEGILFWSVREGAWKGVPLGGLKVMAVVKSDATLGDLTYQPRAAKAVLIVDKSADARQREALADFARTMSGRLIANVADVKTAPIEAKLATCSQLGCASVKAGDLVDIRTSCMGGDKHAVCGNEETYYPPLSDVQGAYAVFADLATYTGDGLNSTWQIAGKRSGFLATFGGATPAVAAPKLAAK